MLRRANNYFNKHCKTYTLPPKLLRMNYLLRNISTSESYQSTSLLADLQDRRFCKSFCPFSRRLRPSGETDAFERRDSPASNHITINCGNVKTKLHAYERQMQGNIQDIHTTHSRPRDQNRPDINHIKIQFEPLP